MNGTVPSTENAGSIKAFKARGQAIADQVSDAITRRVLNVMKSYYEGIGTDDEMMEEARLAGYENYDDFLEETDDFRLLVMETAGAFIDGFNNAWFYAVE